MQRTIFTDEHHMFRQAIRKFIENEAVPHHKQWEHAGIVPREFWLKAGTQGYLCMDVPEAYGGGGVQDFRYATIMTEEFTYANCTGPGFSLHNDVAAPYILHYCNDEQRARWFPQMATGEK
ncbi:MAG: acyl-CoA dehydrogenase family protein, partial [Chloroflexota bacterium]